MMHDSNLVHRCCLSVFSIKAIIGKIGFKNFFKKFTLSSTSFKEFFQFKNFNAINLAIKIGKRLANNNINKIGKG